LDLENQLEVSLKLGVCYYPEHWPVDRWPIDARLMREAGLSLVRIGEFAWAKMEPAEGNYQWEWIDRAIDVLANEGLQIVLCTPTATPPAWLIQSNSEILPVDSQGRRKHFGSRRYYCSNNPVYRRYSARIVSDLAKRYGSHPAIVGWQIDNEFGDHNTARCYCPVCASAFRQWLQTRYGSLDTLNQSWGSIFWSQVYTAWDQIEPPQLTVTTPNPSQVLDFYRFSSDSVVNYQKMQVDLLRQHTREQFITHTLWEALQTWTIIPSHTILTLLAGILTPQVMLKPIQRVFTVRLSRFLHSRMISAIPI